MADRSPPPELPPGSIVVCDNLPAHKIAGDRQCLEDAGVGLLYLPPYSPETPDFNPIEQVFAKALLNLSKGSRRLSGGPPRAPSKPS